MRIVALSDTHMRHAHPRLSPIPDGDVLVHTGDICGHGNITEVIQFNGWLGTLPHKHKVIIAGNHDWCFALEEKAERARSVVTNATYLEDSSTTIDGLKFYGSPWQPRFFDWAFNMDRDELREKWKEIPDDTDVLLTHGPPYGIYDRNREGHYCGCPELKKALKRVKPLLHVFGHIHEGYGMRKQEGTIYANASCVDRNYRPRVKPALVIDL